MSEANNLLPVPGDNLGAPVGTAEEALMRAEGPLPVPGDRPDELKSFGMLAGDVRKMQTPDPTYLGIGQYLSQDFGKYKQDLEVRTPEQAFDLPEHRGQTQSSPDKLLNGLIKASGKTLTATAGGLGTLAYGTVQALTTPEGGFSTLFNNDFGYAMDHLNEILDDKLPNHYTQLEREKGLWDQFGTMNFWSDSFLNGMSFLAGAALTEGLISLIPGGAVVGAAAISARATRVFKTATQGAKTLAQVERSAAIAKGLNIGQDVFSLGRQLWTGAGYEASVEARQAYDGIKNNLLQETIGDLVEQKEAELGRSLETEEKMALLSPEQGKMIHSRAATLANAVFVANIGLVGYGNAVMVPRLFGAKFGSKLGRTSTAPGMVDKLAGKVGMGTRGADNMRKVGNLAYKGFAEGVIEEGGQGVISRAAQDYALVHGIDSSNEISNLLGGTGQSLWEGIKDTATTTDGQKEVVLGVMLGMIGLPYKGMTTWSNVSQEVDNKREIKNILEDIKKQTSATEAQFNTAISNLHFMKGIIASADAYDAYVAAGNTAAAKNIESNTLFEYVHSKLQTGQFQDILDQADAIEQMSPEGFEEAAEYTKGESTPEELNKRKIDVAAKLRERANKIKENTIKVDRNIRLEEADRLKNPDDINSPAFLRKMLIQSLSTMDNVDEREKAMIAEIAKYTGGIVKGSKGFVDKIQYKDDSGNSRTVDIGSFVSNGSIDEVIRDLHGILSGIPNNEENKTVREAIYSKLQRLADMSENIGFDSDITPQEYNSIFAGSEEMKGWQDADPEGFNVNGGEVEKILGDLRTVRARRQKASELYSRLMDPYSRPSVIEQIRQQRAEVAKAQKEVEVATKAVEEAEKATETAKAEEKAAKETPVTADNAVPVDPKKTATEKRRVIRKNTEKQVRMLRSRLKELKDSKTSELAQLMRDADALQAWMNESMVEITEVVRRRDENVPINDSSIKKGRLNKAEVQKKIDEMEKVLEELFEMETRLDRDQGEIKNVLAVIQSFEENLPVIDAFEEDTEAFIKQLNSLADIKTRSATSLELKQMEKEYDLLQRDLMEKIANLRAAKQILEDKIFLAILEGKHPKKSKQWKEEIAVLERDINILGRNLQHWFRKEMEIDNEMPRRAAVENQERRRAVFREMFGIVESTVEFVEVSNARAEKGNDPVDPADPSDPNSPSDTPPGPPRAVPPSVPRKPKQATPKAEPQVFDIIPELAHRSVQASKDHNQIHTYRKPDVSEGRYLTAGLHTHVDPNKPDKLGALETVNQLAPKKRTPEQEKTYRIALSQLDFFNYKDIIDPKEYHLAAIHEGNVPQEIHDDLFPPSLAKLFPGGTKAEKSMFYTGGRAQDIKLVLFKNALPGSEGKPEFARNVNGSLIFTSAMNSGLLTQAGFNRFKDDGILTQEEQLAEDAEYADWRKKILDNKEEVFMFRGLSKDQGDIQYDGLNVNDGKNLVFGNLNRIVDSKSKFKDVRLSTPTISKLGKKGTYTKELLTEGGQTVETYPGLVWATDSDRQLLLPMTGRELTEEEADDVFNLLHLYMSIRSQYMNVSSSTKEAKDLADNFPMKIKDASGKEITVQLWSTIRSMVFIAGQKYYESQPEKAHEYKMYFKAIDVNGVKQAGFVYGPDNIHVSFDEIANSTQKAIDFRRFLGTRIHNFSRTMANKAVVAKNSDSKSTRWEAAEGKEFAYIKLDENLNPTTDSKIYANYNEYLLADREDGSPAPYRTSVKKIMDGGQGTAYRFKKGGIRYSVEKNDTVKYSEVSGGKKIESREKSNLVEDVANKLPVIEEKSQYSMEEAMAKAQAESEAGIEQLPLKVETKTKEELEGELERKAGLASFAEDMAAFNAGKKQESVESSSDNETSDPLNEVAAIKELRDVYGGVLVIDLDFESTPMSNNKERAKADAASMAISEFRLKGLERYLPKEFIDSKQWKELIELEDSFRAMNMNLLMKTDSQEVVKAKVKEYVEADDRLKNETLEIIEKHMPEVKFKKLGRAWSSESKTALRNKSDDPDPDELVFMSSTEAILGSGYIQEEFEEELANVQKMRNWSKEDVTRIASLLITKDGTAFAQLQGFGKVLVSELGPSGKLYHEAWHDVSLFILSEKEAKMIWDAARRLPGEIKIKGVSVKMSDLTDKQADEFLAEEFRREILSAGAYKIGQDVVSDDRTMIRKFFDFVKNLFKAVFNLNDTFFTDRTGEKEIKALFEKIAQGAYKYSQPNFERDMNVTANMDVEQFSSTIVNGTSAVYSRHLMGAMTNYMFKAVRGEAYLKQMEKENANSDTKSKALTFYDLLSLNMPTEVSDIKSPLHALYKVSFANMIAEYNKLILTELNEAKKQQLIANRNVIYDPSDPKSEDAKNRRSQIVDIHVQFLRQFGLDFTVEMDEDENNRLTRNWVDSSSTVNISPTKSASKLVKLLLGTLENKSTPNSTGLNGVYELKDTLNVLQNKLEGTLRFDKQVKKMREMEDEEPWIKEVLDQLPLKTESSDSLEKIMLGTHFQQHFAQSHVHHNSIFIAENGRLYDIDPNSERVLRTIRKRWEAAARVKAQKKEHIGYNDVGRIVFFPDVKTPFGTGNLSLKEIYQKVLKFPVKGHLQALKHLGIEFSDEAEIIRRVKNSEKLKDTDILYGDAIANAAKYLYKEIAEEKLQILDIFNRDESESESITRYNLLAKMELETHEKNIEFQSQAADGNMVYGITLNTYLTTISNMEMAELEEYFDPIVSPFSRSSLALERTRKNGGRPFTVSNISGLAIEGPGQKGDKMHRLQSTDSIAAHVHMMTKGVIPMLRTAEQASDYGLNFHIKYPKTIDNARDILLAYVADEIASSIKGQVEGAHIQDYAEKIKDLRMFNYLHSSLGKETADSLLELMSDPDMYNDPDYVKVDEFVKKNSDEIFEKVKEMLYEDVNEMAKYFEEKGLVGPETPSGTRRLSGLSTENFLDSENKPRKTVSNEEYLNFVEELSIKHYIGKTEIFKTILGDPALYKALYKRTKSVTGTKKSFLTDKQWMNWLNTHKKTINGVEFEMNRHQFDGKISDGTDTFVVVKEPTKMAQHIEEYEKAYSELTTRAYRKEADMSDGTMAVPLYVYREMAMMATEWTPQQELAYIMEMFPTKIQKRDVPLGNFPPRKFQYAGQQKTPKGKMSPHAYLKMSVVPIYPSMARIGKHYYPEMEEMYNYMKKNTIAGIILPSAFKIGAPKTKGVDYALDMFQEIADKDGKMVKTIKMPGDSPTGFQTATLDYRFMGSQLDIASKFKGKTTDPSQVKSQINSNLFDQGKFVYEVDELNDDEETKAEKIALRSAYDRYHGMQNGLVRKSFYELVDSFKLKAIHRPGKEMVFELQEGASYKEFLNIMKDSAIRRDFPKSLIDGIDYMLLQDSKGQDVLFDLIVNKGRLEDELWRAANQDTVRRKIKGDQYVQMSSLGYGVRQQIDSQGNIVEGFTSSRLSFYKNKKGGDAMGVFVAADFEDFLEAGLEVSPSGTIITKDGTEIAGSELLKMIGIRIPTDGTHSIENIRIEGFLPRTAGPTVVVPSEIVTKSGSDFDIDKLLMFFPSYKVVNKKLVYEVFEPSMEKAFLKKQKESIRALAALDKILNIHTKGLQSTTASFNAFLSFVFKDKDNELAKLMIDASSKVVPIAEAKNISIEKANSIYNAAVSEFQSFNMTFSEWLANNPHADEYTLNTSGSIQNQIMKDMETILMYKGQRDTFMQAVHTDDITEVALGKEISVETVNRYSIEDLRKNPDKIYVFGDNSHKVGKGGQAIIRDEENAFGIPTKKMPSMNSNAFYRDDEFENNKSEIDSAIREIQRDGRTVVFPEDGIGTGLARLKETSPKTFKYLNDRLRKEFGFNNETGVVSGGNRVGGVLQMNKSLQNLNEVKDYNKSTTFPYIKKAEEAFWRGKSLVGIIALSATHHVKAQMADLQMKLTTEVKIPGQAKLVRTSINFEGFDPGAKYLALGRIFDISGRKISDTISQFVNGTVDVVNNPILHLLNISPDNAQAWLFLIRAGVPLRSITYFFNQPILREYMDLSAVNKSRVKEALGLNVYDGKIVEGLVKKYGNHKIENPILLTEEMLEAGVRGEGDPMMISRMQVQVMKDFLTYMNLGGALSDAVNAQSFDTKPPKNRHMMRVIKRRYENVLLSDLFVNMKEITSGQTFMRELTQYSYNMTNMFNELFLTDKEETAGSGYNAMYNSMLEIYTHPDSRISVDDAAKVLSKFENGFISYIMQRVAGSEGRTLGASIERLMFGSNSISIRVAKIQRGNGPLKNNEFIKAIIPVMATKRKGAERQNDYLEPINKTMNPYEANVVFDGFHELEREAPELAKDIMYAAFLQSGTTLTSTSFLDLIPGGAFMRLGSPIIENWLKSRPDIDVRGYRDSFFRNVRYREDSTIVPKSNKLTDSIFPVTYTWSKEAKGKLFKNNIGGSNLLSIGKGSKTVEVHVDGIQISAEIEQQRLPLSEPEENSRIYPEDYKCK